MNKPKKKQRSDKFKVSIIILSARTQNVSRTTQATEDETEVVLSKE
jgi:hypothetical protein